MIFYSRPVHPPDVCELAARAANLPQAAGRVNSFLAQHSSSLFDLEHTVVCKHISKNVMVKVHS